MALVVGYDRHPASRAALRFAAELADALNVALHVVHVVDRSDTPIGAQASASGGADQRYLEGERRHVGAALDAANVQWSYQVLDGDPVSALLGAASEHAAFMIVVGRPEQGLGATLGHIVTGTVARTLIRRSQRPVVVVPDDVGGLK
jgi:nucleotide-binding universal stress UspA family protein